MISIMMVCKRLHDIKAQRFHPDDKNPWGSPLWGSRDGRFCGEGCFREGALGPDRGFDEVKTARIATVDKTKNGPIDVMGDLES
jgi:hypothetical protein